uniref:RxLR effector protein n=1 Tax=Peronospora matthiolae TaxID=2874970 RepID=A0AAV1TPK4_9STRA
MSSAVVQSIVHIDVSSLRRNWIRVPHSARLPHSTIDEDTLMRIHVRVLFAVAALLVGIHTTVALVRTETTNDGTQLSGRIHSTGDNDVSRLGFLRMNDALTKDDEERADPQAVLAKVQKGVSKGWELVKHNVWFRFGWHPDKVKMNHSASTYYRYFKYWYKKKHRNTYNFR